MLAGLEADSGSAGLVKKHSVSAYKSLFRFRSEKKKTNLKPVLNQCVARLVSQTSTLQRYMLTIMTNNIITLYLLVCLFIEMVLDYRGCWN